MIFFIFFIIYFFILFFFIFSRGAYTIFLPGEAENTTFAIGRREKSGTFGPLGKQINYFLSLKEVMAGCCEAFIDSF